jgi:hypothetical protein
MSELTELSESRFVYAGRRLTSKNTLVHAWLPEGASAEHDEIRLFTKAKGLFVGGIYTIRTSDAEYIPSSVTFTGDEATHDVTTILEARAYADGVIHARLALERNAARRSEIKELCAPLRELVAKQIGWDRRAALLAYITAEISR